MRRAKTFALLQQSDGDDRVPLFPKEGTREREWIRQPSFLLEGETFKKKSGRIGKVGTGFIGWVHLLASPADLCLRRAPEMLIAGMHLVLRAWGLLFTRAVFGQHEGWWTKR